VACAFTANGISWPSRWVPVFVPGPQEDDVVDAPIGRRLPRARDVPADQRLPVAEMLEAVFREAPDSGLPQERAMRRDVRRVVRSLERSPLVRTSDSCSRQGTDRGSDRGRALRISETARGCDHDVESST